MMDPQKNFLVLSVITDFCDRLTVLNTLIFDDDPTVYLGLNGLAELDMLDDFVLHTLNDLPEKKTLTKVDGEPVTFVPLQRVIDLTEASPYAEQFKMLQQNILRQVEKNDGSE